MGYKYLVLGAGVGKAIAYFLCQQPKTEEVLVLDTNKEKVAELLQAKAENDYKLDIIWSSFEEMNTSALFRQFNVVISALPAKYNLELARIAINTGVNFCDLGGVVDITIKQINQLRKLALERGVSVIPDCGLMPGLGILFAKKLITELDGVEDIDIYVGGLPQKPKPPLNYNLRIFNEEGLKSICYDNSDILVNGKLVSVPPFYGREVVDFGCLKKFSSNSCGFVEAFVTAGASIAPSIFVRMGVKNFSEKTIRWPDFVDFVKKIPPEEFVQTIRHLLSPVTSQDPDLALLYVRGTKHEGEKINNVVSYSLLDLFDKETGLTAMERTTGFPTAIIAEMIAEKRTMPGVNTPETAFSKKDFDTLWERLNSTFTIKRLSPSLV